MKMFVGGVMAAATVVFSLSTGIGAAATCGNDGAGFGNWKAEFAAAAKTNGIGSGGLAALASTSYAGKTIYADRHQKSFALSLDQFMAKRGGKAIAQRGRSLKGQNAKLFASLERRYGVPAGPLIAIWGMESGFGASMGNSNILSAVATLAYDCRRSAYFTVQLYAALRLIETGSLAAAAIGATHGEIGQTQFLPVNVFEYGVDGDGDGSIDLIHSGADALASTANFLHAHGWRAGAGYQPGQPNFSVFAEWNDASVYQHALAIIGAEIDR